MYQRPLSNRLENEEIAPAVSQLLIWRDDPAATLHCPRCGSAGAVILDCSVRPHAEWYSFSCRVCGLDAPLHRPACPGNRS